MTSSGSSTTAWLSAATDDPNRAARLAAAPALRGESTIAGGFATPSHIPVTIADAIAPTPSTPYADLVRTHGPSLGSASPGSTPAQFPKVDP